MTDRTEAERLFEAEYLLGQKNEGIWVQDGPDKVLVSSLIARAFKKRDIEIARLQQERDLAIAHDRQPYPTAQAYELACKQRDAYQQERDAAIREAEVLREEVGRLRTLARAYLTSDAGYNNPETAMAYIALLNAISEAPAQTSADDVPLGAAEQAAQDDHRVAGLSASTDDVERAREADDALLQSEPARLLHYPPESTIRVFNESSVRRLLTAARARGIAQGRTEMREMAFTETLAREGETWSRDWHDMANLIRKRIVALPIGQGEDTTNV